jgi:hypothetical protein
MDSLESGGYRVDDQRIRGTRCYESYDYSNSSNMRAAKLAGSKILFPSKVSNNNSHDNTRGIGNGRDRSHRQSDDSVVELGIMNNLANGHDVSGAMVEQTPSNNDWDNDGNSESSQVRIIKDTKTFMVDAERV